MREDYVRDEGERRVRSRSVQTEPGPAVVTADRLVPYHGPFFVTQHGDRVHLASYCHGQRNATTASRRLQLCAYCDRARGLYELTPPDD